MEIFIVVCSLFYFQNEFEDELNTIMGPLAQPEHGPHFKTVYPTAGESPIQETECGSV
jgi:hypothetical protein